MSLLDVMMSEFEQTTSDKIYGVVVGVVTNNQDPEKIGRVKVKFPWLNDDNESTWARSASPMAGKGRGSWFLPEVGDEVLVAFEHGDVRFPYVLGMLWNGVDTPQRDNADGKNNERVITSRMGHELVFNDEDGKGQVSITTKAGHVILLDDTSGSESITIKDKTGSNKMKFDSSANSIEIESGATLKIKATTDMEIEAGTSLKIKATTLELNGSMVKLGADANMEAKAGAMMTVKGAMVMIN
ncbi:MAG TPA: phage baseplate assembly protein V [Pyrinomonadaceae bacterium]|jgi:uncharacterized protein involved in type VI secretion and phage assembly|nr:phage baseplate assembly protein V [Pyrinomonadaceae bacterium]